MIAAGRHPCGTRALPNTEDMRSDRSTLGATHTNDCQHLYSLTSKWHTHERRFVTFNSFISYLIASCL